ncbi:hypothetical protein OAK24_02080 [Flavobacteriales bacterium]|nr:hypothetical protein [Flavobacteriales bacterium]
MKKNLRNILALSLGLMTTVAFAQDWGVDSRTRIDMSDKMGESYKATNQRVTLGATWGGSDWGIHLSTDVDYVLNGTDGADASMGVYEAYASTDLMGYATVTAGRQALNNGSGALMSSGDWGARTTWDGMTFALNLDMADITVGHHTSNTGADDSLTIGNMWINAGGEFSGWNVNVLYMTDETTEDAATGIDISGEVMGAGISVSMNTDYDGDDMRVIGLSYAVNDDLGVNVSQTVYSESEDGSDGFKMAGTNLAGGWANGNMGYLDAGDEMLSYGLSYNMAGVSLGATMHGITSVEDEVTGDATETDVMEISLSYSLNDNAGLSLNIASETVADADADKYMWLTLNIGL